MEKIASSRWFNLVSWGITALIVAVLFGFAFLDIQRPFRVAAAPGVTLTREDAHAASTGAESADANVSLLARPAIERKLRLKTIMPDRPRYAVTTHTVESGDSVFYIAKQFGIKPDTLLWANYDILNDTPDSLRVGQELNIPPTDGILYRWKDGDTFDKVAAQYKAKADNILDWSGNNIDLTNPEIKTDQWVMIPGGSREYKQWLVPTVARGHSGTAKVPGSACGGDGPVGSTNFVWPAQNHYLSGNDFYAGHLGIDIAAGMGASVFAADSGVVTIAGGVTSGYGNVIMIDHGNGFVTLYAHLSQMNVKACQSVTIGQLIGLAGSTGNSSGAHLHFEVRENGGFINPWNVLPAP
jgi:murein DD-endopeptidase MepM/ murein hydrolase activator NlpD